MCVTILYDSVCCVIDVDIITTINMYDIDTDDVDVEHVISIGYDDVDTTVVDATDDNP